MTITVLKFSDNKKTKTEKQNVKYSIEQDNNN